MSRSPRNARDAKLRTGIGAALIVAAIYWAPGIVPSAGATASARGCGGIGTAAVDFCLSLDLGVVSAVLRAAL